MLQGLLTVADLAQQWNCSRDLLIPMKVGTDSGLIPGSDSDVIPGVFGAKRRWPSYRA